jgi:hypothetical protein
LEDFDFELAMMAPAAPEPQTRTAQVAETEYMESIALPIGTDIRPTALSLVLYEEKVKALIVAARNIQVTDDLSRKQTTEMALVAKKLRLKVEKIEESPVFLAAQTFVKDIRALCKTLTGPLKNDVENICKGKLTAYAETLRLAQARRDAVAREQARELQAELDKEAAELKAEAKAKAKAAQDELDRLEKEEAAAGAAVNESEKEMLRQTIEDENAAAESIMAPTVVVEVQSPENVVRTDQGSSFTTTRWVAEVVDINLVDRKYLMLDPKTIQKDVDGGLRQAAGFVIREKTGTSLRG